MTPLGWSQLRDMCTERRDEVSARARVFGAAGDRYAADRCRELSSEYRRLGSAFERLPEASDELLAGQRLALVRIFQSYSEEYRALTQR